MKDTEIIVGLDAAAKEVSKSRSGLTRQRAIFAKESARLQAIATKYQELISAVNDPEYGANELEKVNKQKLAAIAADYTALRADVVSLLDWLTANVTEF
jgi:tRNA threonylcarbamoyladenosine modification (KEOPS) complex  Pcc1 subunit